MPEILWQGEFLDGLLTITYASSTTVNFRLVAPDADVEGSCKVLKELSPEVKVVKILDGIKQFYLTEQVRIRDERQFTIH